MSALVVTTMIAFVVALASAIPSTTRPVNIPPPLPVECRRYDGTKVEGLFPGGTIQNGCEFCDCDVYGRVTCRDADCPAPRCADPQEGECCSTCPNGDNCRTPSGKIIKAGETLTEDGMSCSCSVAGYNLMWWDVNPGDGPPADCSPQVCVMEDGTTIQLGQHWVSPNGCMNCTCDLADRPAICYKAICRLPPCVDAVTPPGECCPTCPNVNTCKLDSGEIITKGKILKKDGAVCKCRRKLSGLTAVCTPATVLEKTLKKLKAKLQKKKGQLSKKAIRKLNRRINQLQRQLN